MPASAGHRRSYQVVHFDDLQFGLIPAKFEIMKTANFSPVELSDHDQVAIAAHADILLPLKSEAVAFMVTINAGTVLSKIPWRAESLGECVRRRLRPRYLGNSLAFCLVLGAAFTASACSEQSLLPSGIRFAPIEETQPMSGTETIEPTRQTASITGVRLTQGNAVDCPQLRDDAGVIHVVSYLSPGAPIGARVFVSGFYGITTTCRGTVLVVEEERILTN